MLLASSLGEDGADRGDQDVGRASQEGMAPPRLRVAWLCTYTPEELIRAAGFQPIRPMGNCLHEDLARAHFASAVCPYLRGCVGAGLAADFGRLSGVVVANGCDGLRRLADVWARYGPGRFAYLLDVPRSKSEAAVEYFRAQLERLLCFLEEQSRSEITDEGLHLLPYYPHSLLDTLASAVATVVFEEMSEVFWPELDPTEPLASLARKTVRHFDNGPLERRIATVLRLAREYDVDGLVHFSHWGCRQSTGALPVLADALQREGLPLLVLDGDCVDARSYSDGQHRTRLEGFVELLRERAGCSLPG